MYIQTNKNTSKSGKTYKSVLLCHKYRQDGKIKTQIICPLTNFPENVISAIKNSLHKPDGQMVAVKDIVIEKSIDYGFICILLLLMENLRINQVFETLMPNQAAIAKLMIIGKIVTKGSKLSIFNWILRNDTIAQNLGIDIKKLKLDDLYSTLNEITNLQKSIERKWGMYHKIKEKEIFLYDITSTYFEGNQNELAAFGYNRDKKKGKMQINIGLITDKKGFPIKIQVFEGNINDYKTVVEQIKSLSQEFGAEHIIFVGDRGMRIRFNLEQITQEEQNGVDYITGLTRLEIEQLIEKKVIQLNLFAKELVEIEDDKIRYILSVNPDLEKESASKRNELRNKFEENIGEVQTSYNKKQTQFQNNIKKIKEGSKNKKLVIQFTAKQLDKYKFDVQTLLQKYKMNKFYNISIDSQNFNIKFDIQAYNNSRNLDGKYVIATTVSKQKLDTKEVKDNYKALQNVEHAFRDLKTAKLDIRPIFHVKEETTRAHVLISMFSYCIIKELETKICPFLTNYNKKENDKLSYKDIEEELKMIKLNIIKLGYEHREIKITQPNDLQRQILELLNITDKQMQKIKM